MGESSGMGDGSCQDATIVYAKIHPSIGIARVGNSRQPDGFYIGPQVVDPAPLPAQNYRDSTGALKREVAQFRIYGYDGAGRVTKGDMLAALAGQAPIRAVAPAATASVAAPSTPAAPVSIPSRDGRTTRKRMSPLRRKIAERLVQAKTETAMLTTFNEVNMAPVMELRKRHGEEFLKKYGVKLGFMSFFVKAAVQAMKEVPAINAQLDGEDIVENNFFDIGVAVGTDKGLMVPVVRDCDQLNFAGIEKAIGDFGKRARDGKIQLPELQGGVFTISNGGIYGSMLSTPILNHPQAAIMGLHNIVERPVAENGQVVIRPIMYLALSYDHRIVDGKEAVTFLVKVRQFIEDPQRLLFGV